MSFVMYVICIKSVVKSKRWILKIYYQLSFKINYNCVDFCKMEKIFHIVFMIVKKKKCYNSKLFILVLKVK